MREVPKTFFNCGGQSCRIISDILKGDPNYVNIEPKPNEFANLVQEGFQEVKAHNSADLPMGKTGAAGIESSAENNLTP